LDAVGEILAAIAAKVACTVAFPLVSDTVVVALLELVIDAVPEATDQPENM
jgi:hypothetical protein